MKLSEVNREGEKKRGGLLVSTNTINVTIDLHSLICSVLSLSVSVSAAMAMASASEGCVGPQFNGREGMASQGGLMMRDWKGVMYFSRCRQPHNHVRLIWKGTRSPRQGWCCLGAKVAKLSGDPTPLWANSGIPFASNQSPDKPPAGPPRQ